MTLADLIAQAREALNTAIATRQQEQDALIALRSDETLTEEAVRDQVARRDAADAEVTRRQDALAELETEQAREVELAALQARTVPAATRAPAYDQVARVGAEERTYRADQDRRGQHFERDVAAAFLGDYEARDRLARHMQEERVERGDQLRAVGTGAFAGLVVPQYLTDLYAPAAAARRPFADAIRRHDLPAQGMSVNISRITTSTSAALQASENTGVSETGIDDTLLTIPVQTIAGQQTLSRQAIERGAGVEPIVLDDLFRRYATTLDSTLLNQATTGLAASAATITYTSGTPKVVEAYPQVVAGLAGVESAMLDQASGENIVVMHSRRWYWLQNGLSSTWPLISQPGIAAQMGGTNLGATYGSGVRGVLPNGTPVIVDNNVVTNLGGGTNQDEIYVADRNECHLWEDPNAPMYIRAEQPAAASLGVLMVVYGYAAYTHSRYAHAQKITGTGLVAPAFTGV
ncbi:phage major capsid protein [Actinacidiphila glaucinigra]|uniref:phage major capsid protein n=1 Tax=Actinacidiphila glaucinigra TaxID=235986 RepID=UPI0033A3F162